MKHLRDKLPKTSEMIKKIMSEYRNPALLCSFGKDSMVLLYIMRAIGIDIPCLFFREPYFAKKYEFANRIIKEWDLTCFDYQPSTYSMANENGKCEVIRHFQIGSKYLGISSGNLYEPKEGKMLCGLKDLLGKPTGSMNIPWDVLFCGHKSSDKDPLAGDLTLHVDIHQIQGSASLAYPLRDWTDKDIWDYIKSNNIPYHEDRYEKEEGKDKEDKSFNPDYIPACTRCLDRTKPQSVICPKTGFEVTNIGSTLRHVDMKLPYYG